MTRPGPPLSAVTQRLASAPPDFLDPGVSVAALVSDTVLVLDRAVLPRPLRAELATAYAAAEPTAAAALACWLLLTPGIEVRPGTALQPVRALAELAGLRPPRTWTTTEDGREEAARAFLRALDLRPEGESEAQSEDRWAAVSTALSRQAVRDLAEAQRRADELARALADQRAKEAATQYTYV